MSHRHHTSSRRQTSPLRYLRGLTLIELMVALAVFAVLGTLTYRGANEMFASNQHITGELERWRELVRTFQIVESEILQIVTAQPADGDTPRIPAALDFTADPPSVSFVSLAGGRQPERITFRFDNGRLDWERSLPGPSTTLERDTLIAGVVAVRWLFLSDDGWSETWPAGDTLRQRQLNQHLLPAAIGLELDLSDIGQVNRIYALR